MDLLDSGGGCGGHGDVDGDCDGDGHGMGGGAVGGRTADGGGLNKRSRRRVTQPYCSWGGGGDSKD